MRPGPRAARQQAPRLGDRWVFGWVESGGGSSTCARTVGAPEVRHRKSAQGAAVRATLAAVAAAHRPSDYHPRPRRHAMAPSSPSNLPFHKTFAASAIAACTAEVVSLPLGEAAQRRGPAPPLARGHACTHTHAPCLLPVADTAKVKLQLQAKSSAPKYRCVRACACLALPARPACRPGAHWFRALPVACRGLLGTCATVAREEGVASLWKGLGPGAWPRRRRRRGRQRGGEPLPVAQRRAAAPGAVRRSAHWPL